jgi:hypothetical protein
MPQPGTKNLASAVETAGECEAATPGEDRGGQDSHQTQNVPGKQSYYPTMRIRIRSDQHHYVPDSDLDQHPGPADPNPYLFQPNVQLN